MLTTFFSVYKDFLSRAFWLGNFLPVIICATAHASLASAAFPEDVRLVAWLSTDSGSSVKIIPIVLAGLVIVAWTLAPLVPLIREVLDGRLLPPALLETLRQERIEEASSSFQAEFANATRRADSWDAVPAAARQALIDAEGERRASPEPGDEAVRLDAINRIGELDLLARGGRIPPLADARAATEALSAALKSAAREDATGKAEPQPDIEEAWKKLLAILQQSRDQARKRRDALASRRNDDPVLYFRATRAGDVREETESYSLRVYGVEFDYLWPRLQLCFPKDDPLVQRLSDAQAAIDFSVLSLTLTATIPIFWMPTLAVVADTPWLFLAIGCGGPLVLAFFNALVVQTEIAFGRIVETAVDKYRLDVLTGLLRQPLPNSRTAERALWRAVRVAEDPQTGKALSYWAAAR